jgi:hypothetical protein
VDRSLSRRIAGQLCHFIYPVGGDVSAEALELFQTMTEQRLGNQQEQRAQPSQHAPAQVNISAAAPTAFNISRAIQSRWTETQKYSGDIGDEDVTIQTLRNQYQLACEELCVPQGQRAELIHHTLRGRALDFFHDKVQGRGLLIAAVYQELEQQFLGQSAQLAIRDQRLQLRLHDIQNTDGNMLPI